MRCDILTLFPAAVEAYVAVGVLGRAAASSILDIRVHDLRRWAINRYGQVDDEGFGGGPGMVLLAPVVVAAVRGLTAADGEARVVIPDPRGRAFTDAVARDLAACPRLLFVCGRYEGLDERIYELVAADPISLGDFVLSGGELPALAMLDALARHLPGVVGDPESVSADSFAHGLLDHPVYTRPREFDGLEVPDVLLSGNHERIRRWRLRQSVLVTLARRPDLVGANWSRLSEEVRELVRELAGATDFPLPDGSD
jgi:tRNA (guanine37-N1)-methyltransferase